MKEKVILHIDADSFFASVEISKNPKLEGQPVVTGHERGIATSMSPEAKALGITRGMPVFKIKKYFPKAVIVSSDYEAYAMYSRRMFEIVRRYTDTVEEYSIDECFADLSGWDRVHRLSYSEILKKIQDEIEQELHISVSLGCGPTKVLAKVGSKWGKPHGLTLISKESSLKFLSQIPAGKVWGIGPSSTRLLLRKGIKTAGDFARLPEKVLLTFAHLPLVSIWHELNGRIIFPIDSKIQTEAAKSISRTLSFPAKTDRFELFGELARNVENACKSARHEKLSPASVAWFLKTSEFRYEVFKFRLERPTNIPSVILDKIWEEFKGISLKGKKYRTTGVTLYDFKNEDSIQNDLFFSFENIKNREAVFKAVDSLGEKYGRNIIVLGASLKNEQHEKEGRMQYLFFNKLKKTGKEFSIPYLGEAS